MILRDRDQLWAEAVVRWKEGEKLYLDPAMEIEARKVQQQYNENTEDPTEQMLEEYLDRRLPYGWAQMGADARRNYYLQNGDFDGIGTEPTTIRIRFSALEFLTEYVGMRASEERIGAKVRQVNKLMRKKEDWEFTFIRDNEGVRQRGFVRKPGTYKETEDFEDF